jgi:subtilisin family serine protease
VAQKRGAREIVTAVLSRRRLAFEDLAEDSADDDVYFAVTPGVSGGELSELMAAIADELAQHGLAVTLGLKLLDEDGRFVGLTVELVVRFADELRPDEAAELARRHELTVTRSIEYAGNSYLLVRPGPPSYELLDVLAALARDERVLSAEPNALLHLVADQFTVNDPLWPQLPHLRLIDCDDAWASLAASGAPAGGDPAITIAVIDTQGVTPDHPDLIAPTSKLVADYDFVHDLSQTVSNLGGDHGTQCAGSATAAFNDNRGIAGVAPNCHLIGARIGNALTATRLADVLVWSAGLPTGSPGMPAALATPADVISCSWGESPGWVEPSGSPNAGALKPPLLDALDALTTFGRRGRGCVIVFSVGNDGADFTAGTSARPMAADPRTIAVGASTNAGGTNVAADTRAGYSNFGSQLDLVAPSSTSGGAPFVDPILVAVRVGVGNIDGCPGAAAPCNDYAKTFGGTSHSAPVVAGAAALVLSRQPRLNWQEVRDVLRSTAVKIDPADPNWQGVPAFNMFYGFGRLNVDAAVAAAGAWAEGDIVARDNLTDTGTVPSPGWHATSPDIWVRRAADPIPALAYGDAPPHESPRRGDPNHVYCRVKNVGGVPRSAKVRAMIAHYPGFEFRYPNEFMPTAPPATGGLVATGTFTIGESNVTLPAGSNTIVRLPWPDALVPPATVVVNGVTVKWHPCLLLDVVPHDGPLPSGATFDVKRDNNIAQRNIDILEPGEMDAASMMVAGASDSSIRAIVLTATEEERLQVLVHAGDSKLTGMLAEKLGSELQHDERFGDLPVIGIVVGLETTELPLELGAGQFVPFLIAVQGGMLRGALRVSQLRGDDELAAGFEIRGATDEETRKIGGAASVF